MIRILFWPQGPHSLPFRARFGKTTPGMKPTSEPRGSGRPPPTPAFVRSPVLRALLSKTMVARSSRITTVAVTARAARIVSILAIFFFFSGGHGGRGSGISNDICIQNTAGSDVETCGEREANRVGRYTKGMYDVHMISTKQFNGLTQPKLRTDVVLRTDIV